MPRVSFDLVRERYRPTMLIVDIEGGEEFLFRDVALTGIKKIYMELHQTHRPGRHEERLRLHVVQGLPLRPAPLPRLGGAVQPRAPGELRRGRGHGSDLNISCEVAESRADRQGRSR